jgi:NADH-quinone oxidoreductase subunit L
MGGLGRVMPWTRTAFLVGSLALVGIPPFAGFFSKDSILAALLDRGDYGYVLFAVGLAGTFLTGLYSFRLFFLVFGGEQSAFAREHHHSHHGKEGPFSMVWTVLTLAVLSVVGGFVQFAPFWHPLTDWLEPVAHPFAEADNAQEWLASGLAVALGALGIATAYALYGRMRPARDPLDIRVFANKFYWDELYDWIFYRPGDAIARAFGRFIERPVVAGSIAGVTRGFGLGGAEVARVQNGLVRSYALALAGGLAVLAVVFLSVR